MYYWMHIIISNLGTYTNTLINVKYKLFVVWAFTTGLITARVRMEILAARYTGITSITPSTRKTTFTEKKISNEATSVDTNDVLRNG